MPGKRRRGRPKLEWLYNIRNDLSVRALSGQEVQDSYETSTPHQSGKGCGGRRYSPKPCQDAIRFQAITSKETFTQESWSYF